jgi:hypothetical protein
MAVQNPPGDDHSGSESNEKKTENGQQVVKVTKYLTMVSNGCN